jgi:peroxiredoxin
MKQVWKTFGLALCLSFGLSANSALAQVAIGAAAPNFSLTGHDGKTYNLADYKGKFVVLEWFNNECPFVEKHYATNNMQTLQKTYGDQGVIWLTIISSAEGKQGHRDHEGAKKVLADRKAHPTAMLLDPTGTVGKQYDAKTTPHMYIIDKEGKLIYQGAIDDNSSAKHDTVKTANNHVKAALDLAMAGKPVAVSSTKAYGCAVKY